MAVWQSCSWFGISSSKGAFLIKRIFFLVFSFKVLLVFHVNLRYYALLQGWAKFTDSEPIAKKQQLQQHIKLVVVARFGAVRLCTSLLYFIFLKKN